MSRHLRAREILARLCADEVCAIHEALVALATWLVAEGRFPNRRQAAEALRVRFHEASDLAPPITRLALAFADLERDGETGEEDRA